MEQSRKSNISFCEICRDDVNYIIKDELLTGDIKGETYQYLGKVCRCKNCGSELYDSEIIDYNLKSLYDEYRRKNNIINVDKIVQITDIYKIGKRPISNLLGWGEMTFSRYYNGDIPSKQYSDILLKIYNDPSFYLEILVSNKDKINDNTFEKSKAATLELINNKKNNVDYNSKINDVINYLICECRDITPLALQKALYYIQGFYFAFVGKYIFEEDCEAWVHGPVYSEIYHRYSSYKYDPIQPDCYCDGSSLTGYEKSIIDSVVKNLCCYSGKVLEKMTHLEQPWLITRGDLPITQISEAVISKDLISKFFIAVKDKYNMLEPSDIDEYSKVMFEKIRE